MAASNIRQFRLLLWKNWLLQKRRRALTVFQILLPVIFAFILLLIRMRVGSQFIANPTVWNSVEAGVALPVTIPRQLSPLDRRWRLAFVPNVPVIQRLVQSVAEIMNNATADGMPYCRVCGVIAGKGKHTSGDFAYTLTYSATVRQFF